MMGSELNTITLIMGSNQIWSELKMIITLIMGSKLNTRMLIMRSNAILWSKLKMIITLIMWSNHNTCDEGGGGFMEAAA
jgi:hypothetical protein